MLEFKKLGKDVSKIKRYIERSPISFCDISLGVKFGWAEEFVVEYAVYNDTLILKERVGMTILMLFIILWAQTRLAH